MANFKTVMETVETRFAEMNPVDRYAQLNRFRFKVEDNRCNLIPLKESKSPITEKLTLQEHALQQLCTRVGVPFVYLKKCPPALQELNVAWFMQNGAEEKDMMLRIVRENQVRAIMSDRYAPFDDIELFRILAEFMDGTEKVITDSFEEKNSHVSITWPSSKMEIQPGDIVEQGIHVANSEVGLRSVTIIGFVYRLKCKNGLVSKEKKGGFRHIGDPERIRSNIRQVIDDVKNDAGRLVEKFKLSIAKQIAQPMELIDQLAEENGLSQEEYQAILNSFLSEPAKSLYGVVNAVSNSAQMCPDADRRFEIEAIAGSVLDKHLTA